MLRFKGDIAVGEHFASSIERNGRENSTVYPNLITCYTFIGRNNFNRFRSQTVSDKIFAKFA